ncbi:unknown [Clostridium sp. CAG:813]|nr:unknown [Clostridium sp. CAG:813]
MVFIGMISGIPPAIAASYRTTLLFVSAKLNNSSPCFASNSLFAVTICFPFFIAVLIKSKAGSTPPTSSATMSISGSLTISYALSVMILSSNPSMLRFLFLLRTAIFTTSTFLKF